MKLWITALAAREEADELLSARRLVDRRGRGVPEAMESAAEAISSAPLKPVGPPVIPVGVACIENVAERVKNDLSTNIL